VSAALADLRKILETGDLSLVETHFLHRAIVETPAGILHGRRAIQSLFAAEIAAPILQFDDIQLANILALTCKTAEQQFARHLWVQRENTWISSAIDISTWAAAQCGTTDAETAAAKRLAQTLPPCPRPLGELSSGRGQLPVTGLSHIAVDCPDTVRAVIGCLVLERAQLCRAFRHFSNGSKSGNHVLLSVGDR
jgi:hypothetical protein